MAYTTPTAGTAGQVLTATNYNVLVNDVIGFRDQTGVVPPMCRLVCAASQSINNNTDTLVTLGTSDFDTNSMGTTGAAAKITINTAGVYQVSYSITLTNGAGGTYRAATIVKNGTGSASSGTGLFWGTTFFSAGSSPTFKASGLLSLAATDYLQLQVYQDSGGVLAVGHTASLIPQTFFSAVLVGRTS
jgi:hypothetical protein